MVKGIIAQVLLNVAEATFIHGKMVVRHPFPVHHATIMGAKFWYTQHKFESSRAATNREISENNYKPAGIVTLRRIRHTLTGHDPHGFDWMVSIILESGASSNQRTGNSWDNSREDSMPKTNELAWGRDSFFKFVDYEFSGHENIMRNQMTMMRFLTKDTFERYATEE